MPNGTDQSAYFGPVCAGVLRGDGGGGTGTGTGKRGTGTGIIYIYTSYVSMIEYVTPMSSFYRGLQGVEAVLKRDCWLGPCHPTAQKGIKGKFKSMMQRGVLQMFHQQREAAQRRFLFFSDGLRQLMYDDDVFLDTAGFLFFFFLNLFVWFLPPSRHGQTVRPPRLIETHPASQSHATPAPARCSRVSRHLEAEPPKKPAVPWLFPVSARARSGTPSSLGLELK